MINFFNGFRKFNEENQKAPGFLDTMKKQMRIPKKLWMGMPFSIAANKQIKLDGKLFKGPMTFYVDEFDKEMVTLKLVRNPLDFSNMDDMDDEIDFDNTDDDEEQKFVIPRVVFEKLLEPNNFNGADFQTPAQSVMAPKM